MVAARQQRHVDTRRLEQARLPAKTLQAAARGASLARAWCPARRGQGPVSARQRGRRDDEGTTAGLLAASALSISSEIKWRETLGAGPATSTGSGRTGGRSFWSPSQPGDTAV